MTEIADLELVIRAPAAPAVTSMTEMSTAGQEMAAKMAAATAEVTASVERMTVASRESALSMEASSRAAAGGYDHLARQMAIDSANMEVAAAKATAANEKLGESAVVAGNKHSGMAKKLAMVGVGALGIGAFLVHVAGDFEASTTRLVTSAGEIHSNLELVRTGILQMAGEVGNSAEELSRAMYTIESGGQHGADGLLVLRAAAEGAKAEGADLKVVADAVTSVLVDYHLKASDAALVTSKLVAATSAGKTTFEELAGSMAAVLPVASAAHVPLNDILGDLASMTVHGMSAQQAAENLTDVIRHMQAPTSLQGKELALLGLTTNQLAEDLKTKGLSGTLEEISNRIMHLSPPGTDKVILNLKTALNGLSPTVRELGMHLFDGSMSMHEYAKAASGLDPISAKQALSFATLAGSTHRIGDAQLSGQQVLQNYGQALAKATGDATGLKVALMLTGENMDVTKGAIATVAGAAVEAGNHVKGWGDIQQTFNQKLSQAKDGLGALGIAVGEKLLPHATKFMDLLASGAQWLTKHEGLATTLAVGIVVLAAAFGIATIAMWAMSTTPVFWVIAAIVVFVALLAVGIYELVKHWDTVWGWIKRIALDVWHWLVDAWHATWNAIMGVVHWIKSNIIDPVVDFFVAGWHMVVDAWHWLNDAVHAAAKWLLANVILPIVVWIDQHLVRPIKVLLGILRWEWEFIWGFLSVIIADFRKFWDVNWKAISAVLQWVWDSVIKPIGRFISDYFIHPIAVGIDWLGQRWDDTWAWISKTASDTWDGLKIIWGYIEKYGIHPIAVAIDWLGKRWSETWAWIKKTASDTWEGLKIIWGYIDTHGIKPIREAVAWLSTEWDKIWGAIATTVTDIYNKYLKPIFDRIGGAISDIKRGIGGLLSMDPGKLGEAVAHAFHFADGGWVPGPAGAPHLAIVHGGEFVLSRDMLAGSAAAPMFSSGQSRPVGTSQPQSSVIQVVVNLDGEEMQQATMRSTGRHVLRNGNNGLGR